MRLQTFDQWRQLVGCQTLTRKDGDYLGVAIGPTSDEGRCLIDGELLTAGRILPIRGSRFQVSRARPRDLSGGLDCIRSLQLALIEYPEELAIQEWSRPSATFSAGAEQAGGGTLPAFAAGAYLAALVVPTVNRLGVQFMIWSADSTTFSYRVTGLKWSYDSATLRAYAMQTSAVALNLDPINRTAVFYVENEDYDAIFVAINPTDPATFRVDGTAFGERVRT